MGKKINDKTMSFTIDEMTKTPEKFKKDLESFFPSLTFDHKIGFVNGMVKVVAERKMGEFVGMFTNKLGVVVSIYNNKLNPVNYDIVTTFNNIHSTKYAINYIDLASFIISEKTMMKDKNDIIRSLVSI